MLSLRWTERRCAREGSVLFAPTTQHALYERFIGGTPQSSALTSTHATGMSAPPPRMYPACPLQSPPSVLDHNALPPHSDPCAHISICFRCHCIFYSQLAPCRCTRWPLDVFSCMHRWCKEGARMPTCWSQCLAKTRSVALVRCVGGRRIAIRDSASCIHQDSGDQRKTSLYDLSPVLQHVTVGTFVVVQSLHASCNASPWLLRKFRAMLFR